MSGYAVGSGAFPAFVGPQPIGRICLKQTVEAADVFLGDGILWNFVGLAAKFADGQLVMPAFDFLYFVVEYGVVVFAGEIFWTVEEAGLLVEKSGPKAFVGVAGRLVGEHHIDTRHMVLVVESHSFAYVGLIDDLGAVTGAFPSEPNSKTFIVQRFAYADAMMAEEHIEPHYHKFPVVVVRRDEDDALSLLIVVVDKFAVDDLVVISYLGRCGAKSKERFGEEVGQMSVVVFGNLLSLRIVEVGEGVAEVCVGDFPAVSDDMVQHRSQQGCNDVEHPHGEPCQRHKETVGKIVSVQLFRCI